MNLINLRRVTSSMLICSFLSTVAVANPGVYDQQKNIDDPWTTWYRAYIDNTEGEYSSYAKVRALLRLSHIRTSLLENNLHDAHIEYPFDPKCEGNALIYRSADGSCTDLDIPAAGMANTAFGRNVAPEYITRESRREMMTPNPKVVSETFFRRERVEGTDQPKKKELGFLNLFAASWIQFQNHDWLSHGKNRDHRNSKPIVIPGAEGIPAMTIEQTKQDPTNENLYKEEYVGKTSINTVTHWWDGSQIYGSDKEKQDSLRDPADMAKLAVYGSGQDIVLPFEDPLKSTAWNKQNKGADLTGFNENWWVGLNLLHVMFAREHNKIVDHLRANSSRVKNWYRDVSLGKMSQKDYDENVFQLARLINAAVMAKIHTIEWTPAVLPNEVLQSAMFANWYGLFNPNTKDQHLSGKSYFMDVNLGYIVGGIVGNSKKDYGVPFSITEEFTSVYRLHSLIPDVLDIYSADTSTKKETIDIVDTRNELSRSLTDKHGMTDLAYSFGRNNPGLLVLNNFPDFMMDIDLNIPHLGKMDLGAIDILRDRERGVPRYNDLREAIGLRRIKSYSDFFPVDYADQKRKEKVIADFKRVYGVNADGTDNVDAIDLLVGSLAEEVRPYNYGFGETLFQIFILMASRRLMADRFYTEDFRPEIYTQAGIDYVDQEGTFAKVIVRNYPQFENCVKDLKTAFHPWAEGCAKK